MSMFGGHQGDTSPGGRLGEEGGLPQRLSECKDWGGNNKGEAGCVELANLHPHI